ncbi:MAG: Gfo/Idh/MocA family oxidoreductase [Opitutae bacterium]|nr:Gfo/Idh/MocA family oxidoreductase [Opitutae bacterium]MBT5690479.1 Gfo/Idh/MocA family oxidoreductase [Opitutae bacterium]MBT6462343.1 Gfo/Idh/MocA family oxidoreductase [Opitutae bacterium]MBT6957223.1 Gfo/Idh/MocA family oxidoreductase [Opitutae bacterium]MBT7853843.1 Gfo/Idh/MocA family oxidoreductase [Opitutae bacterium]
MKRRNFLKTSAAATLAAPAIIPSSVLGADAPSKQITLGLIGCGGQGTGVLRGLMNQQGTRALAVCDPDKNNMNRAKTHVERQYAKDKESGKYKGCDTFSDFRELCARKDIDAVIVGTPDHWHALATLEALRNGKDVYCEKPITHLFAEGQAVYKEAAKQKAIFQVGSQQRSSTRMRIAAEVVMNGLLGKIKEVNVGLPTGRSSNEDGKVAKPIPSHLDYDLWCGPSRVLPFHPGRLHFNWRWCLDYGGGQLMDWIGHHNDIAHWGLEMDKSGPIKVEAKGFRYPEKGLYDNPVDYSVVSEYAGGYTVTISNRHKMGPDKRNMGTEWIGENGWVYVDRGRIAASNREWIVEKTDRGPKKAYKSNSHHRNFIEGVRSREECICPAETGHRSATPGHIAYVSDKLGRAIQWDPEREECIGDKEAEKLLKTLNYRGDWKIS